MKTMKETSILTKFCHICGFQGGVCISRVCTSRGMAFWWRDLKVETLSYSTHHFAANVLDYKNET